MNESTDAAYCDRGEIFFLPKRARLIALEEAVIGVPMSIFDNKKKKSVTVNSIIHCDEETKMWANEGPGHDDIGVYIQILLPQGRSLWLSKSSKILAVTPVKFMFSKKPWWKKISSMFTKKRNFGLLGGTHA